MNRPLSLLAAFALAFALACAPSQPRPEPQPPARTLDAPAASERITPEEIDAHLRFLSHDLLEGRAPATRGGRLTEEYIAAQLRASGVGPAMNGSYFQQVPIEVARAREESIRVRASGGATATLSHPEQVVVWAGSAAERSTARGELVFVGYGVTAPENRWDDFGDADVRGKVLLILVNDPPAPAGEPELFGGPAMTYYGRWTYKFEEAERRGAAGALIVHTTERAGYPWQTVVGSWTGDQRMLPRDPSLPAPLGVRGWITDSAATALLRSAGLDLARLRAQAESRDFQPMPTGITIDMSFDNSVQRMTARNVVGMIEGSDQRLRDEFVAFTSHHDHLGIGRPVNGDSIYNGAEDNASGIATVLAIARHMANTPAPRRSLMFVFVTAEESGLLGSAYFAQRPPVPTRDIVANINIDIANVRGRVRDFRVLGSDKSSLGPTFERLIQADGWRISPDEFPERGYFYRSDHFSFAMAGVPAVSIAGGMSYEGRPADWGRQQAEEFTSRRYHMPADEYDPSWDTRGPVQLAEAAVQLARHVADQDAVPTWNRDAEFAEIRERQRPSR